MCGTVYGDMHYKDLLGSIVRVGYCITVSDFHLVMRGIPCQKVLKWINKSLSCVSGVCLMWPRFIRPRLFNNGIALLFVQFKQKLELIEVILPKNSALFRNTQEVKLCIILLCTHWAIKLLRCVKCEYTIHTMRNFEYILTLSYIKFRWTVHHTLQSFNFFSMKCVEYAIVWIAL